MSLDPLSVAFPALGCFMDTSPASFNSEASQKGLSFVEATTNLGIRARRYQTRYRWRELTCSFAPDEWFTAATQGVIAYDPRAGYTPQNPVTGIAGMVESASGKLWRITPERDTFSVEDISSGIVGLPTMRLAWMCQATSYVIRTDGVSPTQIWNGTQTSTSTGYNINAPASSRLPNFAGPVAYTDRIWIVNNGNEVIAGDHIHRVNPIGNDDLLKTTDQTYDITSTSFPAPMDMGDILSMHIVTTARGGNLPAQAEVVSGTDGPGIWGVLSGTPRSEWKVTAMRRIVHPTIGPVGPYAGWASNDELIFRTQEGLTTIKYVDKETAQIGNPYINIGQEIAPLLNRDPKDLLLFASLHVNTNQQRLACTVWPYVDGDYRYHKGFVTAALAPGRSRFPEPMVWEGVSTLPEAMGEVIQFCEVRSVGVRKVFAILQKPDGTKGIAEWTNHWGDDLLADGTAVPIQWQLLTRRLSPGGEYSPANWGDAFLLLRGIRKKVDIKISARARTSDPYILVYEETFTNESWEDPETGFSDTDPVALGSIFTNNDLKGQWLQVLIQGTGCCEVDLAIGSPNSGSPSKSPVSSITCLPGERLCQFDIFKRS